MPGPPEGQHSWWQRGIIYHVYPRSFQDSDGDGVGDLNGITSRMGYLQQLGVDAVWISPIYPSPMADFGYDITNYTGIDPFFGTLADFDRLVAEAHRRGLRVLLDWVPNHTSDQHPWFMEARLAAQLPARLVSLARRGTWRRSADQLAQRLRRQRVAVGRADGYEPVATGVLPAHLGGGTHATARIR